MTQCFRSLLQFANAVRSNRLNNVCTYCTKWHVHLRFFLFKNQSKLGNFEEAPRATVGERLLALDVWLMSTSPLPGRLETPNTYKRQRPSGGAFDKGKP